MHEEENYQPTLRIYTTNEEYRRQLLRLLNTHSVPVLSAKLNKPIAWIHEKLALGEPELTDLVAKNPDKTLGELADYTSLPIETVRSILES